MGHNVHGQQPRANAAPSRVELFAVVYRAAEPDVHPHEEDGQQGEEEAKEYDDDPPCRLAQTTSFNYLSHIQQHSNNPGQCITRRGHGLATMALPAHCVGVSILSTGVSYLLALCRSEASREQTNWSAVHLRSMQNCT